MMCRMLILLSLAVMSGSCMAHKEDSLQVRTEKMRQQSVDYVDNLSEDCTYTDGYQCALQSESDKQSELNRRYKTAFDAHQTVSPVTLKAWSAAHTAFLELTDISAEQKKLKHYRIGFAQADGQTTVWFRPLLLPQIDDGEVVGLSLIHI